MTSPSSETTLMTGATGFLGHYVLRDLLASGHRIVAVLRPPLSDTTDRLRTMLNRIGLDLSPYMAQGQLQLVEGALPDRLPEPVWGRTDAVLHCAASLDLFSNGNGEPFKTNVAGTEAIIEWAIRHDVIRMYAVSTAYTCGWNTGVIKEEYHAPSPEFQTDYERSKWQAEWLLEEWASWIGHSLTLFRPSFLVGDSTTGYTTQFGGIYQFARLISALKDRYHDPNNGQQTYIPLRIPGRPHERQNMVPVDFVSRIIAEVVSRPTFQGRIYHLTNPLPPTNEMIKRFFEAYFGLHGGYFAEPEEVVGRCSPAESLLWDQFNLATPRVVHDPRFETGNMSEVMEAAGLSFPVLDRDRMFRLFHFAAESRWGRESAGLEG